jgi:DNA polymerase-1
MGRNSKVKTLLIDGENLFKIGLFGVKDYYHNEKHVGAIWHFLNTIQKFIEEHNLDKVMVFWDGDENRSSRRLIYPQYKLNRRERVRTYDQESYDYQRQRIKQYMEELFVRQVEVDGNEADDLIAHYCRISMDEEKIIYSGDVDLTQLISEDVSVYSPILKTMYKVGDKVKIDKIYIPHYNILTYKILSGDKSDNIDGIYYLGEKNILKLFPEILDTRITINDILDKANKLILEDEKNNSLKNLLSGKTKSGIFGEEFFKTSNKIIDLFNPLISEDGKNVVEMYYKEFLDPDGRGYKNAMKMMMEDGLFKYLPKRDNAWVEFLKPFLKLTRKEKRKFNN